MDKKKSLIEINTFLKKVDKDFKIKKAIFFGSSAIGNANKDSDIDLIIISDNFEGLDFFERVSKMYDYWNLNIPVDFLCYTEKEFNKLKKAVSIVSHALKNGMIVDTG